MTPRKSPTRAGRRGRGPVKPQDGKLNTRRVGRADAAIHGGPLLTSREAADRLGIGRRTLWSISNMGRLPCVRIGRLVRYQVEDLEAFIERNLTGHVKGGR